MLGDFDIDTESWLYDMKLICQSILSIQPLIKKYSKLNKQSKLISAIFFNPNTSTHPSTAKTADPVAPNRCPE